MTSSSEVEDLRAQLMEMQKEIDIRNYVSGSETSLMKVWNVTVMSGWVENEEKAIALYSYAYQALE